MKINEIIVLLLVCLLVSDFVMILLR